MFEWEIPRSEFLEHVGCDEETFVANLELPNFRSVTKVVPLRGVKKISCVVPMSTAILNHILRKMKTLGGRPVFEDATFELGRVDPSHLMVGQKFVYRETYQSLLEDMPRIFGGFVIHSGISDLGAYFIFGEDDKGTRVLACYLPPLVEKHGGYDVVMDGIHRNFITKQMGTTIGAILISHSSFPFPCGLRPWSEVQVISLKDKPADINDRYFELDKGLFRDLKYLGIDG